MTIVLMVVIILLAAGLAYWVATGGLESFLSSGQPSTPATGTP